MRKLNHMCTNTCRILLISIFLGFTLTGCSYFNETRFEGSLGKDVNLINYSYKIADELMARAYPPLIPRQPQMAVLTTTFVDNNDLSQTSHFGRILQDHIGSRFVQQGYTVNELRMRNSLNIEEKSGETMLSRNLSLIKPSQNAQAVLVGTISRSQRTLYITAKLVSPKNGAVLSARNYRLYMDKNVLTMFNLSTAGKDDAIKAPSEPFMNSVLY